ncbi:hypothetical protein ACFXG4_20170 [Nocardia sp. NPDC059246]
MRTYAGLPKMPLTHIDRQRRFRNRLTEPWCDAPVAGTLTDAGG